MACAVPAKAKQPVAKPAKVKDGVDEMVMQWFADFNRPVTTQGLVDALGSRVTKATCQKSLDALTASAALLCKEIKKAKFYYMDQVKLVESQHQRPPAPLAGPTTAAPAQEAAAQLAHVPSPSSQADEAADVPTESDESSLAELRSQFVELSRERARLECALAQANASRTRADAQRQVGELTAAVKEAASKLESLRSHTATLDEALEDWAILSQRYLYVRKLWRDRKALCELIVDAVAGDGSPMEIYETCGLTTDREMGVSLDDMNLVGTKKRPRDTPLSSCKDAAAVRVHSVEHAKPK